MPTNGWPLPEEIDWLERAAITYGFEWECLGDNPRWAVWASSEGWSERETYWSMTLGEAVFRFIMLVQQRHPDIREAARQ